MLSLEVHPSALLEVEEARKYYEDYSPDLARLYLDEIDAAIEKIIQSPKGWLNYRYGTKRFLVHRFPFAVIYRVTNDSIQIVAVAHLSRRPFYWIERTIGQH